MPVMEKESLLGHTEEARDQWENSQSMFVASTHVQCLGVQFFDKILQAWNIDFILHRL